MPRPARVEFPGAIYHVMSRGVARTSTFLDDSEYLDFLCLLGTTVRKGILIVHAFCLMPNHFHLLLETPLGRLGRAMQTLLGSYAERFNERHERAGHLWQGRYKGLLVEDGDYFLECSRYIHLNPVRAGLAPSPEKYPWSSYSNYLDLPSVVDWIHTEKTLRYFSNAKDYRSLVESAIGHECVSPFDQAKAGVVLGSEAFARHVQYNLKDSSYKKATATLMALRRTCNPLDVGEVKKAVESLFEDYSQCQRTRILMFGLRILTLRSGEEVAQIVERTPSAVTHAVRSIQSRILADPALAQRVSELQRILHLN